MGSGSSDQLGGGSSGSEDLALEHAVFTLDGDSELRNGHAGPDGEQGADPEASGPVGKLGAGQLMIDVLVEVWMYYCTGACRMLLHCCSAACSRHAEMRAQP